MKEQNNKPTKEELNNMVGFFKLLYKIDKRINKKCYEKNNK